MSCTRAGSAHENTRDALYSQTAIIDSKSVSSVQNIGRIETLGIELALTAADLGVKGFDLSASTTFADSKIKANRGFVSAPGDTLGSTCEQHETLSSAPMAWHGHLSLDYRHDLEGRTTALDRHEGPLRVLRRLYPEGPGICHHVLVHPPGGIVGGDRLHIDASLAEGTHALITTPSATRFYRSAGELAAQDLRARLAPGARLEWLPLETLVYDAALAENRMRFELAPGAEMIGWDIVALGLPSANLPFRRGHYQQHLELPGRWLERGRLAADDLPLLNAPLGLAGHTVTATLWFAAGQALTGARREALLDAARALSDKHPLRATVGSTAPEDGVVVLRLLAQRVEPAFELLCQVRAAWRGLAWGLAAQPPRIWRS